MEIPVFENKTLVGTLQVASQGLYTVFETRLPGPPLGKGGKALPGRAEIPLTRLWLLGGTGGAASLGLLEPRGGERRLCRRLSRLELQKLPQKPWTALALPDGERPAAESLPRARGPHQSPAATASLREGKPNTPADASSPWLLCPDGSLYDPRQRLLALPWAGGEPPAPARKIFVGGRDYLVFRY